MARFVAFLRGIGPGNPNMANSRLREAATSVGMQNVTTFISSGNVLFDTDDTDLAAVEAVLEEAWRTRLGFDSRTIVRTRDQLQRLVGLSPFGSLEHTPGTYLLVTFSKKRLDIPFEIPFEPERTRARVVRATERELFTVSDTTQQVGLGVMSWVEGQLGKEVTSRTWLTVLRVLQRLD